MTLDEVLASMYETLCFERRGGPQWQRFAEIFSPSARLVRVTDDGVFEFDLHSYRASFDDMIASGRAAHAR